jgi:hypothetical protein
MTIPTATKPLTRQPGGVQAWKIVVPTSNATPELRAHDGHEGIYVLSGRMRLVLGDQDRVLGPGEVASFDTTEPHWFGSTGANPRRSSAYSADPANEGPSEPDPAGGRGSQRRTNRAGRLIAGTRGRSRQ